MPGKYKLSFIEQCLLALACIFQVLLIFYSLRVNSFVWRKFTAFTLQKILNRIVATMTVLTYVRYYASMKNVIEELRQLDKLFHVISPSMSHRNKLSYTVLRTCRYSLVFYVSLAIYGSLQCAEKFSLADKVWSPLHFFESNVNVVRLCGTKLSVIFELNFVLYAFVDLIWLLKNRLRLLNRLITVRFDRSNKKIHLNHKVIISDHEVATILLIYTKLQTIQRQVLHCFRLPIVLFYSNNVYSLIFITLTAYNQYFESTSALKHAKTCEILLRVALCYTIIFICVLCKREADQIAVNMQMCSSTSTCVKFFLMELRDRKFNFEIFRFFTLEFETFLSMMGFISTYVVILAQFKVDTFPQAEP